MRIGRTIIALAAVAVAAAISVAVLRIDGTPVSGGEPGTPTYAMGCAEVIDFPPTPTPPQLLSTPCFTPPPTPTVIPGPGMSLSGPGTVSIGEKFTITINADPAPHVPVSGFATELLLPPGISWQQRAFCEDENQTSVEGTPVATCVHGPGPNGEARHFIASAIQQAPLPALDGPLAALVELDLVCETPGTHEIALSAVGLAPDLTYTFPFGAVYFETDTRVLYVDAQNGMADTHGITCFEGPVPTNTPCPPAGCPPPTATQTRTPTLTPTSTWTPGPSPTCPHELPPDFPQCIVLDSDAGSGSGPGMSLSGPGAVSTGQTFALDINGDPPPGVPVGGFQSEVVLPAGLSWMQRPTCEEENQTTRDGEGFGCNRFLGPNGEARHAIGPNIGPPWPALDEPLGPLVELDVRCEAAGTHALVLTAVTNEPATDSPYGALYFDTFSALLLVDAMPYNIDADATLEAVADVLIVECTGPQPNPTATFVSEIDPAPAIITPAPTDFSDVSPALATPRGTALGGVQSPDAGGGAQGSNAARTLTILVPLAVALFVVLATALRRLGPSRARE